MGERFVSFDLASIAVGEPLPVDIYVYINFRFITYKAAGDSMDLQAYERFELKNVRTLFILDRDQPKFDEWVEANEHKLAPTVKAPPELEQAREGARRATMDIFQSGGHPDTGIQRTLVASKTLVGEVMKFPYAVQSLSQLQNYSKGTVDHSVNVSVLSIYLAMQMGYSHNLILQHVGLGGLLHDIGKSQVLIGDADSTETADQKMEQHPELGAKMLEDQRSVPNEVKMIVAQHHERFNGTGYPKKLRGNTIYDLSRIVAIANVFDELVSGGQGTLVERQRVAVRELDEKLYKDFDPQKLEKALKILKLGV